MTINGASSHIKSEVHRIYRDGQTSPKGKTLNRFQAGDPSTRDAPPWSSNRGISLQPAPHGLTKNFNNRGEEPPSRKHREIPPQEATTVSNTTSALSGENG